MIVVVTGPESVGKTTLCRALSAHYRGAWEPEYARTYLESIPRHYTYDDVEHIARIQYLMLLDYRYKNDGQYVFFDTYLIITKIWFQKVYGLVPQWIDGAILGSMIDFALLLEPDVPWEADPLRENGAAEQRRHLFNLYKQELEYFKIPYSIVGGNGEQRVKNSVNGIESFLRYKPK